MKGVRYSLRLTGLKSVEGTIPLCALKEITDVLLLGTERALRLSVEGASIKKGRTPAWLTDSLEFVITGIRKGSTVLEIEAPTLEETASEQIKQQGLWYTVPRGTDTAISLLSRSIKDAVGEKLDSVYYDRGVLNAINGFSIPFSKYIDTLELNSRGKGEDDFKIAKPDIQRISQIEKEIPEPRSMVIAGIFNLIEHTQNRFQLTLSDGRKIFGKIESPLISKENMRSLWGEKVTIKGIGQFSATGKLRFIEAQLLKTQEKGEELFEHVMEPRPIFSLLEVTKPKARIGSPLKSVWGQWPGNESIEELLLDLKNN